MGKGEDGHESTSVWELHQILNHDVEHAWKELEAADRPYRRRVFVRAVFASIEATTYLLKQEVLDGPGQKRYSAAELALLREESYSLNGRCEAVVQSKFVPLDQNFRFAIALYVRDALPDFKLDLSDAGWESFRQSLQLRHRITHPKQAALVVITDDELRMVKLAFAWFNKTLTLTLCSVVRGLKKERDRLHELVDAVGDDNKGD